MGCISDVFVHKKTASSRLPNVLLRTFIIIILVNGLKNRDSTESSGHRKMVQLHFPWFNLDVTTTVIKRSLYSADVRVCRWQSVWCQKDCDTTDQKPKKHIAAAGCVLFITILPLGLWHSFSSPSIFIVGLREVCLTRLELCFNPFNTANPISNQSAKTLHCTGISAAIAISF